jgi:hypothetical protein
MKVVLNVDKIQRRMVASGATLERLATIANVAEGTASRAVRGLPVTHRSAMRIAAALEQLPANPALEGWLAPGGGQDDAPAALEAAK